MADQAGMTFHPFNAAERARNACGRKAERRQQRQYCEIEKALPCHRGEISPLREMMGVALASVNRPFSY